MVKSLKPAAVVLAALLLSGCPGGVGNKLRRPAASPVATPTRLTAVAKSSFEVGLTWDDNSVGETGFRLEVSPGPFASTAVSDLRLLPANTSTFSYPTAPKTTYYFRVFAVTESLQSDPSNEVAVTTPRFFPVPSDVRVSCESPILVVVRWTPVSDATSYWVETSRDGGSTWGVGTETIAAPEASSISVGGLTADTEYLFRVLADYGDGFSDPSPAVGIITLTTSVTVATVSAGDGGKGVAYLRPASGTEHLSHYDAAGSNVLYTARTAAGTSSTTTVDAGPSGVGDVGGDGTSIALDGTGALHIVAHDLTHDTLRYATNASGAWTATTIDAGGGGNPRIGWNPANGALHVIYQDASIQVKHLVRAAGHGWDFSEPINYDSIPVHDLAIDPAGAAHVILISSPNNYPLYGVKPLGSGVWQFEGVPLTPATLEPDAVSLALDAANVPHLALHDPGTQALYHATKVGSSWVTEPVDRTPGADVGAACSLAVQRSTGRLHVAYYDATRQDLRYARRDSGQPWVRRLLDATGDVGSHVSIAVDAAGGVAVAYRDETNRRLKIARGAP